MRRHVVRIVVAVALLAGGAAVSPVVAADTPARWGLRGRGDCWP